MVNILIINVYLSCQILRVLFLGDVLVQGAPTLCIHKIIVFGECKIKHGLHKIEGRGC